MSLLEHRATQIRALFADERVEAEGLPHVEVRINDVDNVVEVTVTDAVDSRSYAAATEVVRSLLREQHYQAAYGFTHDDIKYGLPYVVVFL